MGPGVPPGWRPQSLGGLLGRRAQGTAWRWREEQVSPVAEALVLVIGHRRDVAELSAPSNRSARPDGRLAGAAHHAEPRPRVPQSTCPVRTAEGRPTLQSTSASSSSSSTTTESLLAAEVLAEHKIHDYD